MAKLYFYFSAMNAGKSTSLLQSAHNYAERGMRTLLFTPRLDNRAGVGKISSRLGISAAATAFEASDDLYVTIRDEHASASVACVFIDEAQFLSPKQVLQLTIVCDDLNSPVLCYGLRTDFRGEPFDGSKYLLAWAESLVEIKTICESGAKATMNARLDADGKRVTEGAQVDIGHHYDSMSRKAFGLPEVSPIGYERPD
ncbi:MAG: thymidine kinase [Flavobacteriales bacterium]|jgi:thymidine kinase